MRERTKHTHSKEIAMLNKITLLLAAGALMALVTPTKVDAYGAAHVGYTHVGPNGVYHTGETAVAGPGGVAVGGRTTAAGYGGGVYHEGAAAGTTGYGGAAYGGSTYHYSPSYYGGTAVGGASYGYVR
jgi:hypothetical protein